MKALWYILIVGTVAQLAAMDESWTNCPPTCKCKWVSGRKVADCSNASLTSIPSDLSPEIQAIDLSYNTITSLPANAFKSVRLVNLHKIFLKSCNIEDVDKEAFTRLEILIELDLSNNRIHTLHPMTFRDNVRLRIINLHSNRIQKLEDGLFNNMKFLQTVDLSDCQISHIGHKAFVNLPDLKKLKLNKNNLTSMKLTVVENLRNLVSLDLYNNPWHCDCHLKPFLDWTIYKNLYTEPTACEKPSFLKDRYWKDVTQDDLACKPTINIPFPVVEVMSGSATLHCQAIGTPMPEVHWVFNSRIIGSPSSRRGYDERKYIIHESTEATKWVNLTVLNVKSQDSGDYTCVAKNAGGMEERNVSLRVSGDLAGAGIIAGRGYSFEIWALIIGLVLGAIVLLVIIITVTYWFCCRRKEPVKKNSSDGISSNGDIQQRSSEPEEKSLLTVVNPVQKPPRRAERASVVSAGTEHTDVKHSLLDDGSAYHPSSLADSEDNLEDRSLDSVNSLPPKLQESTDAETSHSDTRPYPPDLLSFPSRTNQISPAGSTTSTAPDNSRLPTQHVLQSPMHSPVYHQHPHVFGTLPYSRSASPFSSLGGTPVVVPRHQGYVTIPRRPRVPSWSSAPPGTPTGETSPLKLDPIYDNLGPRTTADGSSVLSLNKSGCSDTPQQGSNIRVRPLPPTPNYHNNTLPSYYTPIEEQSPFQNHIGGPVTSSHKLSPNCTSPSAVDLDSTGRQRASWSRNAPDGASLKKRLDNEPSPAKKRNSVHALPSVSNGQLSNREIKVPPKPPPKPKKRNVDSVTNPLFEDEGEDGTEV